MYLFIIFKNINIYEKVIFCIKFIYNYHINTLLIKHTKQLFILN